VSRPALGPTQPPVQWVPGVLSPGVKRGRGVMLTTHPHLVSPLPPSASMVCSGTALPLPSVQTTGMVNVLFHAALSIAMIVYRGMIYDDRV
jgi:hypothetical protein